MNEELREDEKKDYFHSLLKSVENELKKNKTSYVFSNEQLEFLKSRYDIEIVSRDECCIYIKLKK